MAFCENSEHDFSRSSTLSFKTMMKLMITMGQSIHRELYSFLGFKTTTPTSSAFVQRRNLIYPIEKRGLISLNLTSLSYFLANCLY